MKQRPLGVWLIAIFFAYYGTFPFIDPFLLHNGVSLPLFDHFPARHMNRLDYIPFFFAGGLCAYGAVSLFQLKRIALYLLPIGGLSRGFLTTHIVITKFGVDRITPEMWKNVFIGSLMFLGAFALLFLYLLRLSKKGVLR
jgi:hypothetical protein